MESLQDVAMGSLCRNADGSYGPEWNREDRRRNSAPWCIKLVRAGFKCIMLNEL